MKVLILLSLTGVASLFSGFFGSRKLPAIIALAGLIGAAILNVMEWGTFTAYFNNMVLIDDYAIAFTGVLILSAMLVMLLLMDDKEKTDVPIAETAALMLFSLAGATMLVSFSNMLMLFLGIEILSIPLYILAGAKKHNLSSNEASIKYFLLGAFATAFLLFGIVLIYGVTGSFHLSNIAAYVTAHPGGLPPMMLAGIIMIIAGLGFKVSAVPFHFWAPDVYYGSPTLTTTFMATLVKTAAIAGFLRLFMVSFATTSASWVTVLSVIAVLTMSLGNILAVYQTSLKRMMAYSGIAHAGYILIALVSLDAHSDGTVLYYTLAYSVSTICAFAGLMAVAGLTGNDSLDSFKGLAKNNTFLAVVITIALLSLAGIPPTAGFFAKFSIFSNALREEHYALAIIAVLNACVGIYYYFRIIPMMYSNEQPKDAIQLSATHKLVMIITVLLIIVLGLFPHMVIGLL